MARTGRGVALAPPGEPRLPCSPPPQQLDDAGLHRAGVPPAVGHLGHVARQPLDLDGHIAVAVDPVAQVLSAPALRGAVVDRAGPARAGRDVGHARAEPGDVDRHQRVRGAGSVAELAVGAHAPALGAAVDDRRTRPRTRRRPAGWTTICVTPEVSPETWTLSYVSPLITPSPSEPKLRAPQHNAAPAGLISQLWPSPVAIGMAPALAGSTSRAATSDTRRRRIGRPYGRVGSSGANRRYRWTSSGAPDSVGR